MTQSNSIDYNDTISGTQLANFLNDDYEALLTNHKGSSRPSYIQTGQFWIDDSSTPWAFNIYDGSNDITLFNIDPSGDSYTLTDFDVSSLAGNGLADDGTGSLEFNVTYSSDGTTTITGPTDVNFSSDFTVTDDGDGTVTIGMSAEQAVALDLGNDGTDESTDLNRISTDDDRNNAFSQPNTDEFLIEANKIGATEGYLQHDGLVISNNSTDADHNIDTVGGAVGVHDFSGNWQVIELNDESPAFQIDTTGDNGLINTSSLTADTWYELAVIADSSGSNSPSVVGYTDANRPTASGDLPSGYDLFRAMGSPGKTWWVKTDSSSDILQFDHSSDGTMRWNTNAQSNFSVLLSATSDDGNYNTVDISNQAPPQKTSVKFNGATLLASGGLRINISGDNNNSTDQVTGDVIIRSAGGESQSIGNFQVHSVNNQEIFWVATVNSGNLSSLKINTISSFKAVD